MPAMPAALGGVRRVLAVRREPAGGQNPTDVELLIALSDDTPGLRDCGAFQLVCEGCSS